MKVYILFIITASAFLLTCEGKKKVKCAGEMQLCTPPDKMGDHPYCCPPADCLKIVIDVGSRPRSERFQCFTTPADAPKGPNIKMGPHLNDEDARFWDEL